MKRAAIVMFGFLAAWSVAQAQERLQPGLWAVTTTIGATPVGPANDICVTAQDGRSANGTLAEIKAFLDAENAKNKCTLKDLKVEGQRVTIVTDCDGTSLTSVMTYAGASYEGSTTMLIEDAPKRVMVTKGQRKGPCP